MIGAFIESMLGGVGRAIFHFYQEYSLFINGFIILYGLCVFFAHRSFNAVLDAIKKELKIDQQKETGKEKVTVLIRNTVFDWSSLSRVAWFPFIAIPGKIMIHWKNESNLRKAFSVENLLVLLTEKAQKK
jgi:hypothetical protein